MTESKNMTINSSALEFVKDMYKKKFGSLDTFEENYNLYLKLPIFRANENIHEKLTQYDKPVNELIDQEGEFVSGESIKPEIHWIMRSLTQYYLTEAFKAMKIDLNDPNIAVNSLGKGTPGRIAKTWVGNDAEDTTELLSGRWNKEPALSVFPNDGSTTGGEIVKTEITKKVDIVAVCSHHFLPFSTLQEGSYAIISYIPRETVLGISKLQRFTNWASRRGWLQEDLTNYLGKTIKRIAKTPDVKVVLVNLVHSCEKFRGAQAHNGALTTTFVSGVYAGESSKKQLNE